MPVGRPRRSPDDPMAHAEGRVPSAGTCADCGQPSALDPCVPCHVAAHPNPVADLLADEGTTLARLADDTGIPERTLRRAAAGEPLSLPSARRIADALGLDLLALLTQGRKGLDDDR